MLVLEDTAGVVRFARSGSYLFVPLVHTIVGRMPIHDLSNEFIVEAVETRTFGTENIDLVRVRMIYYIEDYSKCYLAFVGNLRFTNEPIGIDKMTALWELA